MTLEADAGAAEIGVEWALALQYAPVARRRALGSVWRLDARMRRILTSARDPALAQIKLAWWHEALTAPDAGARGEPLLRDLAEGAPGLAVAAAAIPDGWRDVLTSPPSIADLTAYAASRGRGMVAASAIALEASAAEAHMLAGEGWALLDRSRSSGGEDEGNAALALARSRFASTGRLAWPRPLRPLGMIVELARSDLERGRPQREGSPGRMARMAWHAITGR